ncbi:hypothetical protein TorRG33x02_175210, partial [Trema orientale]
MNFNLQPYNDSLIGYVPLKPCNGGAVFLTSEVITTPSADFYSNYWFLVCSPCSLLTFEENTDNPGRWGSITYLPHRVMRQFGYDQLVPFLSEVDSVEHADSRFLHSQISLLGPRIAGFLPPQSSHVGRVSMTFVDFWNNVFSLLCSFVRQPDGISTPPPISERDLTLFRPHEHSQIDRNH